ncbi:hypothetical protein GBAR_LOCUS25528 [Geodia barretti]|uniref:Uncharacterized protein n=1 Tax=Geodia barretti TaxID=519541 RepID=A0AA35XCW5_GEOBA|nr:hypothetical protein GBAR_LOCUS25528 [Geodia barretti]
MRALRQQGRRERRGAQSCEATAPGDYSRGQRSARLRRSRGGAALGCGGPL